MALDKTAILNATCTHVALENAGAEVSTSRVAVIWTDSGGNSVVSGTTSFTGPADAAVDTVGFYDDATAGTKYGTGDLTYAAPTNENDAFNAEGEYNITSLTITG